MRRGKDGKLPDPLMLNDGKRVTTANMWWTKRRPQIVELFDRGYVRAGSCSITPEGELGGDEHGAETVGGILR